MPPHRFPLPLTIGTDICHIPRIARIITRRHDEGGIDRFATKIFNPFERKIFQTRLQRYRAARDAARVAAGAGAGASKRESSDGEVVALNAFARWVAGRFAAKEATIKAVTRRLYYRDVTILVPVGGSGGTAARKPYALIDPPARTVEMSRAVAAQRGVAVEAGMTVVRRPAIFRWRDRAVARLSIAHDGEYATATVLAADDGVQSGEEEEVVVDDGKGKPLHVPSLGDVFARMYDVQLNELVRRGEMARLREAEEGRGNGVDAELLNRLRELRAELVARGLPTEMVDEGSSGDEEGDGV